MCIVKFVSRWSKRHVEKETFYTLISHANEDSFGDLYVSLSSPGGTQIVDHLKTIKANDGAFYDNLIAHRFIWAD